MISRRNGAELLLLAAIWGGSFLFMRIAAPEFGSPALVLLRVGLAGLVLLPVALIRRSNLGELLARWRPVLAVGAMSAALPFLLYAYAAHSLSAGLLSVANASTPIWTAIVGRLWLKDRLPASRMAGLAVGMAGILVLVWDKLDFGSGGSGLAVLAAVGAPMFYGLGTNATKRYLGGIDALANATGNMLSATLLLLPLAILYWPDHPVSWPAWSATLALALLCTGLAYALFFRLLLHMGPTGATNVTFLIPVFGMLWGLWFLGESITPRILAGAGIILAGTALALGLWPRRRP
jgi:drug/metabolite transporter (DMT)-like permease